MVILFYTIYNNGLQSVDCSYVLRRFKEYPDVIAFPSAVFGMEILPVDTYVYEFGTNHIVQLLSVFKIGAVNIEYHELCNFIHIYSDCLALIQMVYDIIVRQFDRMRIGSASGDVAAVFELADEFLSQGNE